MSLKTLIRHHLSEPKKPRTKKPSQQTAVGDDIFFERHLGVKCIPS